MLKPKQMLTQMCWNELIIKVTFRSKLAIEDINDVSKSILSIVRSLCTPSKKVN